MNSDENSHLEWRQPGSIKKIVAHADEHLPGEKMMCPNAQGMCVASKSFPAEVVFIKPRCQFAVWLKDSGSPTSGPFAGDMLFYSNDGTFIERRSFS